MLSAEVTFLYLHGIVELFLFPLLLHSFLLFLQELLSLEVASGTVFHGVVCVLGICLREKRDSHVIVPGQFCPSHPVAASRATCKRFPISFTPQGSQTPMAFCSAPADVLLQPTHGWMRHVRTATATIKENTPKGTWPDSVFAGTPLPCGVSTQECPQTAQPPQKAGVWKIQRVFHLESDLCQATCALDVEAEDGKSQVHFILNSLLTGIKLLPFIDVFATRLAPGKGEM